MNECQTKEDACDKNAICINHDGSYECRCRKGFSQAEDEGSCVENNHLQDGKGEIMGASLSCQYIIVISIA